MEGLEGKLSEEWLRLFGLFIWRRGDRGESPPPPPEGQPMGSSGLCSL